MWTWLFKFLPKISPLAEAQKLHYETEIRLLDEKREKNKERFDSEARDLRSEVQRLKDELQQRPQPAQHGSDLPEIQVKILVALAQTEIGEAAVAQATGQ